MPEIYEDIDALVLQFVKDGTDKGLATTNQIINGCSHTGWKSKQVKEALEKLRSANIIDKKSTGEWYVVKITHDKIPPHDENFSGYVDATVVIDALIQTLEDFKTRSNNIVKLNFDSSMFHMNLEIKLVEK